MRGRAISIRAAPQSRPAEAGPQRLSVLPNVPTFKEARLPEQYASRFGMLARGYGETIVGKAGHDLAEIVRMPDFKARFETQGAVLASTSRFAEILKEDG